ncbi:MAG: SBBP repeat-containing protein [Bacteroidota bacterium]|nr:SBBP repeat-containing protein [Bacteroidota bacterium]
MKNLLFIFIFIGAIVNAQNSYISFTENKGQISDQFYKPRPDILFAGSVNGMAFHLRNNGISYQLNRVDSWKEEEDFKTKQKHKVADKTTIYRIDINWLGINANYTTQTEKALEGYNNYYLEVCPNGVHNVKSYEGVFYNNIYSNINLHYYQKNNALKYDYIVAPGGNYKQIQLQLKGATAINLQKDGSLLINTPLGKIQEGAPLVYQNGKQLKAKWQVTNNVLVFDIENYNPKLELIIDPAVRLWGSYYGGTGSETSSSCATDPSGNVYIAGSTNSSTSNISTVGSHQTTFGGGANDAFLVKFNTSGIRQWGTYYGGSNDDNGLSCSTDNFGNIYLSGNTASNVGNVIATVGSHQTVNGGGQDAFLVQFNSNGIRQWGTFYGGLGSNDNASSCSTDAAGNVYIFGNTDSNTGTIIATPSSHQPTLSAANDAFVAKFNSSGVRQWATYYGGTGADFGNFGTVDQSGNIYLLGYTSTCGGTNIATIGSHQPNCVNTWDSYLVKFNSIGVRQWGTYYGGNGGNDYGYSCSIDISGNIYFVGTTDTGTGTVIATAGSHQNTPGGAFDAFLVKFDALGVRQWATYYGSTGNEYGLSSMLDNSGNIYISGSSSSVTSSLIATSGNYQSSNAGGGDAYVAKFNSNGIRQWGTYYGGTGNDNAYGSAIDATGNFYLTGVTTSSAIGTSISTIGSNQYVYGGGVCDGFLVKFCNNPNSPPNTTTITNQFICSNNSTTLSASGTSTLGWYSALTGGTYLGSGSVYTTPILTSNMTYYVQDSSICASIRTPITVTVNSNPTVSVNSGAICSGQSFTITPGGASTFTFSSATSVVSPTVNSTFSVTGTSSVGCISSNTAISSLTVYALPTLSVNSGNICNGSSFIITPSGANTYTISGGASIVNPTISSSYSVTGTDINGCVSSNFVVSSVTVNALPIINTTSSNSLICTGQTASINATGANTYTWSSGGIGSTEIVSPTVTTNYTVNGTDANGCNNTSTYTQSVSLCTGVAALSGVEAQNVSIFPNPTSGMLNVVLPNSITEIKITNTLGQIVQTTNILNPTTQLNIQNFPAGIYFLQVFDKGNLIATQKIIKE